MAAGSSRSTGQSASRPATRPERGAPVLVGVDHVGPAAPVLAQALAEERLQQRVHSQMMMVAKNAHQKLSIVKSSTIQLVR